MGGSQFEQELWAQQLGPGPHVLHLPQVGSTSSRLKELIIAGQVTGPTVLVTSHQTAGRGTRTRSWISSAPEETRSGARARDLALTFATPIAHDPDQRLSLAIGALLADTIERCTKVRMCVKWPNDLLAGDPPSKVGGVLLEQTHGWMLVGVGLNVNSAPEDFPADIAPLLTTLARVRGKPLDVSMLQLAIVKALRQLPEFNLEHWLARFHELDCTAGTRYMLNVSGFQIPVTAQSVDASGELLLHDERGGEHRIAAFTELERL